MPLCPPHAIGTNNMSLYLYREYNCNRAYLHGWFLRKSLRRLQVKNISIVGWTCNWNRITHIKCKFNTVRYWWNEFEKVTQKLTNYFAIYYFEYQNHGIEIPMVIFATSLSWCNQSHCNLVVEISRREIYLNEYYWCAAQPYVTFSFCETSRIEQRTYT